MSNCLTPTHGFVIECVELFCIKEIFSCKFPEFFHWSGNNFLWHPLNLPHDVLYWYCINSITLISCSEFWIVIIKSIFHIIVDLRLGHFIAFESWSCSCCWSCCCCCCCWCCWSFCFNLDGRDGSDECNGCGEEFHLLFFYFIIMITYLGLSMK